MDYQKPVSDLFRDGMRLMTEACRCLDAINHIQPDTIPASRFRSPTWSPQWGNHRDNFLGPRCFFASGKSANRPVPHRDPNKLQVAGRVIDRVMAVIQGTPILLRDTTEMRGFTLPLLPRSASKFFVIAHGTLLFPSTQLRVKESLSTSCTKRLTPSFWVILLPTLYLPNAANHSFARFTNTLRQVIIVRRSTA